MVDKSRVGIYRRISDDREGRELGVQRQEEDCRELLQRLYDEKVARGAKVYTDNDRGASDLSKKKRPDFERLLADAKAGRINHIVSYSTSRLTRRPREFEDLIDLARHYGVTYSYVRSPSFDLGTADGREFARGMAARDAGESERIGERVTRAMQQIAEQGGYRGGIRPFGFERDGVTVRPEEAEPLRDAAERILAGESMKAIAREWNVELLKGVANWGTPWRASGGRWRTSDLSSVLRRPRNAGLIDRHGEIIGKAQWPAIVPEETWRALMVKLNDLTRLNNRGNEPKWLGSGIYLCGGCLQPNLNVSMSGGRKANYRCFTDRELDYPFHVSRGAEPLDAFVEAALVSRLSKPDVVEIFAPPVPEVDVRALHAEGVTLGAKLRELEDMLGDGELDRARYNRQVARVEERLAAVRAELTDAGGIDPVAQLVTAGDVMRVWFGQGPERAGGLPLSRRRAILQRAARVTVMQQGRGRFDSSAIKIEMPPPA